MKKILLATLFVAGSWVTQAQYYIIPSINGGNPRGLNTDPEYPSGGGMAQGWNIIQAPSPTATWSTSQTIPFSFSFNGVAVTQFKVSTSGVLTFDVSSPAAPLAYGAAASMPLATIDNNAVTILGIQGTGTNDNIVSKTFGTAPNRQLFVQFNSYTPTSNTTDFTYWSIVLEETTNNIYIVDQRTSNGSFGGGLQYSSTSAFNLPGAPTLASTAGTDANPGTNTSYAFIPGVQPAVGGVLNAIYIPSKTSTGTQIEIKGLIYNYGLSPITSATVNYTVNGGTAVSQVVSGLNIAPGTSDTVKNTANPFSASTPGAYDIALYVTDINGIAGINTNNLTGTIAIASSIMPEVVVFEHFTNASCGPCAAQNPAFTSLLNSKIDKATSIKYHTSWPGVDPMYSANTVDPTARVGYYNVTGVPDVYLGNSVVSSSPASVTATQIDNAANQPAAFNYTVSSTLNNRTLTFTASATAINTMSQTDLVLHTILVEDPVTYTTAPGNNGETEFPSTVRKMFPSASGTPMNAGGATTFVNQTFNIPAGLMRVPDNMYMVMFVQSNGSKQVWKGAKVKVGLALGNQPTAMASANINIYPNPTTDVANISFETNKTEQVQIAVINMMGQTVKTLDSQSYMAGKHTVNFNTENLANGFYTVRMVMDGKVFTGKLNITK